ncbi:MAG TPA: CorA family divalent cation transporter, partial [Polyangiales bacterium]
IWLHLNLADGRARSWMSERANLPEDALSLMLDPHPRVRVQTFPRALVGIVEDLHHDFRGDPEGFGELRFFVDEARVISARRHPLKSVDAMRHRLLQGDALEHTGQWLELLIEALAASFAELVRDLVERVDRLEDEIVAGHSTQEQRSSLAGIRRLLVRFRRHVHADRQALSRMRPPHERDARALSYRHNTLDQLDAVGQDLDLVHERVRLLQEEVSGMLAEATNRNLFLLSIVTTALLPATLMTGIWGMNVGGLPWSEDSHGFLWSGLSVLGPIALSLALLRGTRVL